MRRVKSRNFILIVCGILISLLLGVVIAKTVITFLDEVSKKDVDAEIQKNIISSSSKVRLNGFGNFIEQTPKLSKTVVSEFNVFLKQKDDEVSYTISFCNMNDVELKYDGLKVEGISCSNDFGNISCNNVKIESYLKNKRKVIEKDSLISANSCVDLVVDAKYIGDVSDNIYVYIDKIALELKAYEK